MGAVNKLYLRTLNYLITGFANITTRQMLVHLYTTYGRLTPADVQNKDATMKELYNAKEPIESLFHQIEESINVADAPHSLPNRRYCVQPHLCDRHVPRSMLRMAPMRSQYQNWEQLQNRLTKTIKICNSPLGKLATNLPTTLLLSPTTLHSIYKEASTPLPILQLS
jgi:hypothetical protein